jgi:spermidine/putrescine transport system ATP-binding protein
MSDQTTTIENSTESADSSAAGTDPPILEIEDIIKDFGDLRAVDVPSITLRDGEFFTLVGPSGSGKSTLLRMIAGLETPSSGRIKISGEDVTTVPANKRPTALIFQHFQLFPHKPVAENIAFPLKMNGVGKAERQSRASELLKFVDLEGYEKKYPEQLSGGEQQRISLARGLISEPDILLLDEPLASLDRNLREQLQVELRKFQRRLGTTFIYVTHNQEVALTMSDRIAVMDGGSVEQLGEPMNVYKQPETEFVATFLGEVNTIDGTIASTDGSTAVVSKGGVKLTGRAGSDLAVGESARLCVKSEAINIEDGNAAKDTRVTGTLQDEIFTGKNVNYFIKPDEVDLNPDELIVSEAANNRHELNTGDTVTLSWEPSSAHIFPTEK